ncbi:DUF6766 family protein [Streptomyces sp. NPDC058637]|uniref:DUF6766 family protein n=1 Tax=Streptomyces sp. NPDC058637 TaxID=3346569 RepID=UPI00366891A9
MPDSARITAARVARTTVRAVGGRHRVVIVRSAGTACPRTPLCAPGTPRLSLPECGLRCRSPRPEHREAAERGTRRFVRDTGNSLGFGAAFLLAPAGQAIAGRAEFNNKLVTDGLVRVGFLDHLTSPDFAVDVTENWQSECLHFFLSTFATVWLLQRGSPESKEMDKAGPESDKEQGMGGHGGPHAPRRAGRPAARCREFGGLTPGRRPSEQPCHGHCYRRRRHGEPLSGSGEPIPKPPIGRPHRGAAKKGDGGLTAGRGVWRRRSTELGRKQGLDPCDLASGDRYGELGPGKEKK